MYMPTEATIPIGNNPVVMTQETNYPWDGNVKLTVNPKKSGSFAIKLRIPGWARNEPLPGNLYKYLDKNTDPIILKVNGRKVDADIEHGYVALDRTWKSGDVVDLTLPMQIRRVVCHPNAKANNGLVAIERGPIVYCAEFKDNDGLDAKDLKITDNMTFKATFEKDVYNGVVTLTGSNGVKLIPYYLYSNRGAGWMRVWMPRN